MLNHLDNLLRELFLNEVAGLRPSAAIPATSAQVGIQPPDDDWRNHVNGLLTLKALNIYLIEIRENRELRSNQRLQEIRNGRAYESSAWARMDCHYLITAWSPGQQGQQIEPTIEEHELLYQVAATLFRRPSLVARQVYAPKPVPTGFPLIFADVELPTTILPVEGFPKYAEFWGTMGQTHPWKPAVYLIVTVPLVMPEVEVGGIVTSVSTGFHQLDDPEAIDTLVDIGGRVLDDSAGLPAAVPLVDAWVLLETASGVSLGAVTTDAEGRFAFHKLKPGNYRLRWRDGVRPEPPAKAILIPGSTSDYELILA